MEDELLKYHDKRNKWIQTLEHRRGKNITAVAVANKNARIAWALLSKQENYRAVYTRNHSICKF